MPTFREDLLLGHEVATVETDDLINKSVTEEKLDDDSVSHRTLQVDAVHGDNIIDNAIKSGHISADAVTTPKIKDKAVTPEKVSDNFRSSVVLPFVTPVDQKYANITKDLQNQIDSLEIAGLALSQQFGDNPYIGISQKKLTEAYNILNDLIVNGLATEKDRAEGVEAALQDAVAILQELAEITIDGGDRHIATAEDMVSHTTESRAKVPTVAAIQDSQMNMIHTTEAAYNLLPDEDKEDERNWYFIEEE